MFAYERILAALHQFFSRHRAESVSLLRLWKKVCLVAEVYNLLDFGDSSVDGASIGWQYVEAAFRGSADPMLRGLVIEVHSVDCDRNLKARFRATLRRAFQQAWQHTPPDLVPLFPEEVRKAPFVTVDGPWRESRPAFGNAAVARHIDELSGLEAAWAMRDDLSVRMFNFSVALDVVNEKVRGLRVRPTLTLIEGGRDK